MKVSSQNIGGEGVVWLQWSRFKRRERSMLLFVWAAVLLHLVFWVVWYFFIAPYPIAVTIPLGFDLPTGLLFLHDYLWPMANALILAVNIWLVFKIYKKDIFASWLLLGGNLFVQFLVLSVTLYLASFSSPF